MTTTGHHTNPETSRSQEVVAPKYQRKLHRSLVGVLNSDTEASLLWSALVLDLEETDLNNEHRSFRDQLKIIESWDTQDDFYSHLDDTRARAQRIVDLHNPGSIEAKAAQRELDALAEIMDSGRVINNDLAQAAEGLSGPEARAARTDMLNSWINQHNEVVDRVSGTAESERQSGSKQPENTPEAPSPEAVDTSRENKEKVLNVLDMVVGAAKDHTYIHTDTRPIPVRHGREMRETERTGFQNFGDAPDVAYFQYRDALLDRETTEAVVFQPDTTPVYKTETYVVKTSLFGKQQTAERQIPNGESLNMVKNHTTGEEEPGVKMTYQFFANGTHYDNSILPRYQTSSGRPGNVLVINTVLPKSVAEEFKQIVQNNPLAARAFAEAVMFNNGVTEEAWTSGEAPMRPPYDALPADWTLSIIDTDPGYRGHDPNHTRRTKVPVATS